MMWNYPTTVLNEKSAQRRRKHGALAVSKRSQKNFAPPETPFAGARDGQNLISWRCSLLHLQTQFGKDRCTQFRVNRGNRLTNTHKQGRLQYTAPQLSVQCNERMRHFRGRNILWPPPLSLALSLSLHFNSRFPGELGLTGAYWSKGWWKWWWQLELQVVQSSGHMHDTCINAHTLKINLIKTVSTLQCSISIFSKRVRIVMFGSSKFCTLE